MGYEVSNDEFFYATTLSLQLFNLHCSALSLSRFNRRFGIVFMACQTSSRRFLRSGSPFCVLPVCGPARQPWDGLQIVCSDELLDSPCTAM